MNTDKYFIDTIADIQTLLNAFLSQKDSYVYICNGDGKLVKLTGQCKVSGVVYYTDECHAYSGGNIT